MKRSHALSKDKIRIECERMVQDKLLDPGRWDDPGELCRWIGMRTVWVSTEVRVNRKEKDGWSPQAKGLVMNIRAILVC